ncbi:protein mono-ADP-ribosyltransferase PARP14-like [Dreissena polymorpha]|uniref:protein mono-ADP-ribosyltransferase PARP14-like n=1 Tax=Dreissena polymorpha TaxID=45954 RepID=UPI00226410F4|nr:protein mono-ADP-ribosyltransferase PARP14-like [Dreissena polymorpha]
MKATPWRCLETSSLNNILFPSPMDVSPKPCDLTSIPVLVSTTSTNLDLRNGAVSKTILKQAGPEIQQALKLNYPKGLSDGGVAVTKGYNLKCAHVIHGYVAPWDGQQKTRTDLRRFVTRCLEETQKMGHDGVAVPAIGTGALGYPKDVVATEMLTAVSEFAANNSNSPINRVEFVLFPTDSDTIKAFELEFSKWSMVSQQNRDRDYDYVGNSRTKGQVSIALVNLCGKKLVEEAKAKRLAKKPTIDVGSTRFQEMAVDTIHLRVYALDDSNIRNAIKQIIKDAIQIENDSELALMCKAVVKWFFIEEVNGDEINTAFPDKVNLKIEQSYKNKEDKFIYRSGGLEIVVDFKTLQKYEKGETDDSKKLQLVRKDLIEDRHIETPSEWKKTKGNCYVNVLLCTDLKYEPIENTFKETSGPGWTVLKIEEVQNKALWRQYHAKKKQLEEQNPPGTTNERFLWHGTTESTVDSVNLHGFNRSYCGKNATYYGCGVYFAIKASYSTHDIYSKPDANGVKRMYYCSVLTGEYAKGDPEMRVPPPKPSGGKHALYDSVTNSLDLQDQKMFIIFNDTQAYPLFIISFKKST